MTVKHTTISTKYYDLANRALELAKAKERNVMFQLCAIVVSGKTIVSVGFNTPKTHTISRRTTMQQLHAEMSAIIQVPYRNLDGCDLIVVRATRGGKPGMSKPCRYCEEIISKCGARRVLYTTGNGTWDQPELARLI